MKPLDSLSAVFFEELRRVMPNYEQFVIFSDRPELVIPAKHPETGELHVWLDGDEITVGVGNYFHTHFETYIHTSGDLAENESAAAGEAVGFIEDVLADKVAFWVSDRSAGSYYPERHGKPPLESGIREFVWSGPFGR